MASPLEEFNQQLGIVRSPAQQTELSPVNEPPPLAPVMPPAPQAPQTVNESAPPVRALSPLEEFHQQLGITKSEAMPPVEKPLATATEMGTGERLGRHFISGALGTAEGLGGALQWVTGGALGKDFSDYMGKVRKDVTPTGEASFIDQLASGAGSMATFFIPGFGVGRLVGALGGARSLAQLAAAGRTTHKANIALNSAATWFGAGTMAITEAATEAGQVYRNELEKNKNPEEASSAASWTFWLNLPVLAITDKLAFFGNEGKALSRALRGMVTEGSQESLQEVISTWSQEDQQNLKNILTSGAVGAIIGGGTAAIARPAGLQKEVGLPAPAPGPGQEPPAPVFNRTGLDTLMGQEEIAPTPPPVLPPGATPVPPPGPPGGLTPGLTPPPPEPLPQAPPAPPTPEISGVEPTEFAVIRRGKLWGIEGSDLTFKDEATAESMAVKMREASAAPKPGNLPTPPMDVSGTAAQTGATGPLPEPLQKAMGIRPEPKAAPKIKLPTEMTDEEIAGMTDEDIDAYARKLAAADVSPTSYSMKDRPAAPIGVAAGETAQAATAADEAVKMHIARLQARRQEVLAKMRAVEVPAGALSAEIAPAPIIPQEEIVAPAAPEEVAPEAQAIPESAVRTFPEYLETGIPGARAVAPAPVEATPVPAPEAIPEVAASEPTTLYDRLRGRIKEMFQKRQWGSLPPDFERDAARALYEREFQNFMKDTPGAKAKAAKATTFAELSKAVDSAQTEWDKRLAKAEGKVPAAPVPPAPVSDMAAVAAFQNRYGTSRGVGKATGLTTTGIEERPSPDTLGVTLSDRFPRDQITVNPDLWQHKLASTGAGEALKHIKTKSQWDYEGVKDIYLYRFPDGHVELMDGHSRTTAGDRVGITNYPAVIFDGTVYTVEQARAKAALINIKRGTGTIVDSAKAIRDLGMTREQLADEGVNLNEESGKIMMGLAELSDPLFSIVGQGKLAPAKGAIIGELLPGTKNHDAQEAIYKLIAKKHADKDGNIRISNEKLKNDIRFSVFKKTMPTKQKVLGEEFEDAFKENLVGENSALMTSAMLKLARAKNLFTTVTANADRLVAAGNELKPEANQKISADAAMGMAILDKAAFIEGSETNKLFSEYALKLYQDTKNAGRIKEEFYVRLPGALEKDQGLFGLGRTAGEKVQREVAAPDGQEAEKGPEKPEPSLLSLKEARQLAPTFYSQMANHLEAKLPGKGSGADLAKIVEGWGAKGQFKADELKWSGLIPWLREQQGPVTKQQVADFLKENQVEVREVVKESGAKPLEWKQEGDDFWASDRYEYSVELLPNGKYLVRGASSGLRKFASTLGEAKSVAEDMNKAGPGKGATKFQSYLTDLPESFTNRREILLTVPTTLPQGWKVQEVPDLLARRIGRKDATMWEVLDEQGKQRAAQNTRQGAIDLSQGLSRGQFQVPSSHGYGDPAADVNRFAHVFTADYVDPKTGKKSLVITELQSDWAAKGRGEGYKGEPLTVSENSRFNELSNKAAADFTDAEWPEYFRLSNKEIAAKAGAPPLPFAKNWHEVALKRAIRFAAENGYDGVMVVNGEMVKQRYDLSKKLHSLDYTKNHDGTFDIAGDIIGTDQTLDQKNIPADKLDQYVGKEVADKIISDEGKDSSEFFVSGKILSNIDLQVGGAWANNLYDKTIPSYLRKYVRQWGAEVGEKEVTLNKGHNLYIDEEAPGDPTTMFYVISTSDESPVDVFDSRKEAQDFIDSFPGYSEIIRGLDITPAMRDSVLYRGQPMFALKENGQIGLFTGDRPLTKFEKRLNGIISQYPGADPGRVAQAMRAAPKSSDREIAGMAKMAPAEAAKIVKGTTAVALERAGMRTGGVAQGGLWEREQAGPGGPGGLFAEPGTARAPERSFAPAKPALPPAITGKPAAARTQAEIVMDVEKRAARMAANKEAEANAQAGSVPANVAAGESVRPGDLSQDDQRRGREMAYLASRRDPATDGYNPAEAGIWEGVEPASDEFVNSPAVKAIRETVDKRADVHEVITVADAPFDAVLVPRPQADGYDLVISETISRGTHEQQAGHEVFHLDEKAGEAKALALVEALNTAAPEFQAYRGSLNRIRTEVGLEPLDSREVRSEVAADLANGLTRKDLDGQEIDLTRALYPAQARQALKDYPKANFVEPLEQVMGGKETIRPPAMKANPAKIEWPRNKISKEWTRIGFNADGYEVRVRKAPGKSFIREPAWEVDASEGTRRFDRFSDTPDGLERAKQRAAELLDYDRMMKLGYSKEIFEEPDDFAHLRTAPIEETSGKVGKRTLKQETLFSASEGESPAELIDRLKIKVLLNKGQLSPDQYDAKYAAKYGEWGSQEWSEKIDYFKSIREVGDKYFYSLKEPGGTSEERQGWVAPGEPVPSFKEFEAELAKDDYALERQYRDPANKLIPLYEGERYLGTRGGDFIKDAKGKVVKLTNEDIYERLYAPTAPTLPQGTETARKEDLLGAPEEPGPEGTVEAPPATTILRSLREKFAAANLSEKSRLAHQFIVEHLGWGAREIKKDAKILEKYSERFGKMSREELLAFTDAAETGKLDTVAPDLQEAGQAWRRISDGLHALLTDAKGGESAYWENYFPRLFKDPSRAAIEIAAFMKSRGTSLTGPESFNKVRTQLLLSDSLKSKEEGGLGLEPRYDNYVDMMKANIYEKVRFLTGKYIEADLIDQGFITKKKTSGWEELAGDKTLKGYYAHPDVARVMENFLSKGLRGDPLFELYNNPVSFINTALVGLSAFHATFSTFSDLAHGIGSNLTRAVGAAVTGRFALAGHHLAEMARAANVPGNLLRGGKYGAEYMAPGTHPEMSGIVDLMTKAGIRFESPGFKEVVKAIFKPGGVSQSEMGQMSKTFAEVAAQQMGAPRKVMETIAWPIMSWMVPRIKINATARLLQMELDTLTRDGKFKDMKPTEQEQFLVRLAQDVARKSDNIFGQMVYDNLSMKRGMRDGLRVLIGFPGWNIGSFTDILQTFKGIAHISRQVGLAGHDIAIGRKPTWTAMSRQDRMSMEFYLGTAMIMAVFGALMQKMLAGDWPEDAKDLFMPRTGEMMSNGQPERLRAPTYMRDVLSLNHPVEMIKHKLNFPLRMFSALVDNQDFFGTQIRDPYAGPATQAGQVGKYAAKSLLPFGIQGYLATESPKARALNLIGITKVPRMYSNTDAMNVIDEYNKMNRATMSTQQAEEERRLKGELRKLAQAQDEAGFQEAARVAMEEGKLTRQQIKTVVDESQAPPGLGRFVALPVEWQVRAWKEASDKEKEIWQPYFLKKVRTAKTEILIRHRDILVPVLREMGLEEVANEIQDLKITEKAARFDLALMGIRRPAPELDIDTADIAIAKEVAAQEEKLGAEKKSKRKPDRHAVLGF